MTTRCGYIALVGRPNVGKSTLLNRLVGYRVSAIANKPQTTRYRIEGIVTEDERQLIFVDTPGLHRGVKGRMNKALNAVAVAALQEVDVAVFVVEAGRWSEEDEHVLRLIGDSKRPVLLAINKVDQLKDKGGLLAFIDGLRARHPFTDIVPISAQDGTNLDRFKDAIARLLPESEFMYPQDQITDQPVRFIAAEMIREQIMRLLHKEVPYAVAVEIERFEEGEDLVRIEAVILVEREGQKAIVIGRQGSMLKRIGSQAREVLEHFLEKKVFLQLFVKVSENWSEDARKLARLGIDLH